MSCCGNKRKAWTSEITKPLQNENNKPAANTVARRSRIFEYTGKRSRKYTGAVSGQVYHFRFSGHRLSISYQDSFGLMGESDLQAHRDKSR